MDFFFFSFDDFAIAFVPSFWVSFFFFVFDFSWHAAGC